MPISREKFKSGQILQIEVLSAKLLAFQIGVVIEWMQINAEVRDASHQEFFEFAPIFIDELGACGFASFGERAFDWSASIGGEFAGREPS